MVDEMSLGLAPVIVERLMPVLRRIADEFGTAVLFVEQHVPQALELADRAYVMVNGQDRPAGHGGGAPQPSRPARGELSRRRGSRRQRAPPTACMRTAPIGAARPAALDPPCGIRMHGSFSIRMSGSNNRI